MKVAFIAASFPPSVGGFEHVTYMMASSLAAEGNSVDVFTHAENAAGAHGTIIHEIRSIRILGGFFPIPTFVGACTLLNSLLGTKYSVVVTNTRFFLINFLAAIAAKIREIPVVHVEHGAGPVSVANWIVHLTARIYDVTVGRLVVEGATIAVGISPAGCQFLRRLGARDPVFARMPFDLGEFFVQKRVPRDTSTPNILFVGRIAHGKGLADLLRAVDSLRTDFPRLRITVVGAGPDEKRARALAAGMGGVIFVGEVPRDKLPEYYAQATVVVCPSHTEGLGLVPLEATAVGVPVIASRSGGPDSWLLDSNRAFLFNPRDVAGLADTIRRVLENYDEAVAKAVKFRSDLQSYGPIEMWMHDWSEIVRGIAD